MDWHQSLNPDCTGRGYPEVRLEGGPSHGSVSLSRGKDYSGFPQSNPISKCNVEARPSTQIWYTPAAGYLGTDAFEVLVIYPSGNTRKIYYNISVR